jgi:hypothetical protein
VGKPDPTAEEINAWLDNEPINPADAYVGAPIRAIRAARKTGDANKIGAAVRAARDAGYPWSLLGAALGINRQAAEQQFGGRPATP